MITSLALEPDRTQRTMGQLSVLCVADPESFETLAVGLLEVSRDHPTVAWMAPGADHAVHGEEVLDLQPFEDGEDAEEREALAREHLLACSPVFACTVLVLAPLNPSAQNRLLEQALSACQHGQIVLVSAQTSLGERLRALAPPFAPAPWAQAQGLVPWVVHEWGRPPQRTPGAGLRA